MADKSIKITIDSALNAGGFRQAEAELGGLASNVKKAAGTISKIAGALALIPAAFKKGFDIGTWISDKFVMPFMKARGAVESVTTYSDKFFDMMSKASADGLEKIADAYKSITSSAKAAADSRQRETRYLQDQLKLLHEAKDAEKELAKQRKLSALAPDDAYGRAKIEQEFAAYDGIDAAVRSKEDAVIKRQNLEKEAEASNSAADAVDEVVAELEKRLVQAKTRAGTLSAVSTERNEKDLSWKNWFGVSRTSEGDELREKQKKAADDARKEVEKIQADIAAKREEAAKLRADAEESIKRREALWSQIETAEVRIEAERLKNADAVAKIEADHQKEVEEAKKRTLEFEKNRLEYLDEYKKKISSIFGEKIDVDVNEPKPVDVKVNEKGIEEVKKAFEALATAKTDDEIKSAKKSIDVAIKLAKAELEARRDGMKKLHDQRMKQLDDEQEKLKKQIDDAKAKGFDNLMATAGGGAWGQGTLDQAGEIRAERQKKIGEDRAQKAEDAIKKKMEKLGATLDDPSKLGRMSNLERAAFERLKLKDAEKKAADIQKAKEDREKQMAKDLDDINKKLKEVGL